MNRTLVWRTVQNSSWLLGGFSLLGLAFFLWIGIQIHHRIVVEKPVEPIDLPVEPEKVKFSPTLGMLTDMVPELNLNEGVTNSAHTAEFRGFSFLKQQNNRWTVEIMSVTQEEVIKNYLLKRKDREQFYYFRYVQPNQPERYLLTFGSFKSVSDALNLIKKTDFALPASIKVMPQQFAAYKKFVTDDVGSEDTITNMSGSNKIYQVRLRSVAVPVETPVIKAPDNLPLNSAGSQSAANNSTSTKTSVTPVPTTTNSPSGTVPNPTTTPVVENPPAVVDPFN